MVTWGLTCVAGAYLLACFPSSIVMALAAGRREIVAEMSRGDSKADAHYLLRTNGMGGLATAAVCVDILKVGVPLLAARLLDVPEWTLAGMAVAAVLGSTWPFAWRRAAGRGLSATAGACLVIMPPAMFLAGAITGLGTLAKRSGVASTIGFSLLPAAGWAMGEPWERVAASGAMLIMVGGRRLEGWRGDVASGLRPWRVLVNRLVHDEAVH
ncbi:MAG: glycerol-3-phosphate acyltransferase [Actinomycetota bacterium]